MPAPTIDLPADLRLRDQQPRGAASLHDSPNPERIRPGAVVTAGTPDAYWTVLIDEVRPDGTVTFWITLFAPDLLEVELRTDRRVWMRFADGHAAEVDLRPVIWGPAFEQLREDDDLWAQATLDGGTLTWPGNLDLSPEHLWTLTVQQARWPTRG